MNRRSFLTTSLAAGVSGALPPLVAQPPRRPNIIIFLADDLGWADVGYHGSEIKTPTIDRLAQQGVQMDRAYSFPVCSPTRSAIMTGRSPMRLGIIYTVIRPWASYGLPVEEHIIPQTFKAAGYETAITGKWHLGHSHVKYFPGSRGFDHTYGHMNGAIDYFTHEREGGLDWNRDGKSVREEGYSTTLLGQEAIRLIKNRDRNKPFFLYLPFNSPHAPLEAPPPVIDKYANIADRKRRTFAAMVDVMDTTIGKVLATLDEERMTDNTIVMFVSDNGGPTISGARNTPLRGAKGTTFEGGTRVPCIIRWPGHIKPGTKSSQVVTAMDYFPTLAAAADVTPQNRLPFDGRNMWPAITGGKFIPREDLFFAVENNKTIRLAVHHGEWKLVRELPQSGGTATNYLFRIHEDPNETNDLSAKHPDIVNDLAQRIEKWRTLHPKDGVRESQGAQPGWKAPKLWAEGARRD